MMVGPRVRILVAIGVLCISLMALDASPRQPKGLAASQVGPPAQGYCLLFLYRDKSFLDAVLTDEVSLDGVPWGKLEPGDYLMAHVSAGPHEIHIGGPRHRKRGIETLSVTLTAGKLYYLHRHHGFRGATSVFVDPIEGRKALASLDPSPVNFMAQALPRADAAGPGMAQAGPARGGSQAVWASWGPWAEVGMLISAEKGKEAIALACRELLSHGEDYRGYFLRGLGYFLNNDHDFAISNFDHALALKPDDAEALAYRGMANERARHFREAEADFRAATRKDVDSVDLYFDRLKGPWTTNLHRRLASVLMALDRPAEALVEVEEACRLEPENHFILLDRARTRLAAGKLDGAWDDAMTLAGLMPQMPWTYDIMGQVRWWQGRYEEAISLHQRALDRAMNDRGEPGAGGGSFLANLARAEVLAGHTMEALRHIEAAIRAHHEKPVASDYLVLGVLLHDAGRSGESDGAFRRAAELDNRSVEQRWKAVLPAGAAKKSRAFIERQYRLAKSAVVPATTTRASIPVTTANRAIIHELRVEPSPVSVGEAFDFHVDFTVTDPAMPEGPIPANMIVEIYKGGVKLFSSPVEEISGSNGFRSSWVHHMNPTAEKGDFRVRVHLSCRGGEATAEVAFSIE